VVVQVVQLLRAARLVEKADQSLLGRALVEAWKPDDGLAAYGRLVAQLDVSQQDYEAAFCSLQGENVQ
jgi:hypothetical protein